MNLQWSDSTVVPPFFWGTGLGDLPTLWTCSLMHGEVLGERWGPCMVPPVSLIVPAGPHSQIPQFSNPNGVSAKSNIFRDTDLGHRGSFNSVFWPPFGAGCSPALDSLSSMYWGCLKQDSEILSLSHQPTAPNCVSAASGVPSWMPHGFSPSYSDHMAISLQIHQDLTHSPKSPAET